ncbi:hypothetical protein [Dongia sp.]|uniref:hypothetical protein n=1 Tax=Dongia sp. TaxID=1977262 RepID=UPI0035AEBECA
MSLFRTTFSVLTLLAPLIAAGGSVAQELDLGDTTTTLPEEVTIELDMERLHREHPFLDKMSEWQISDMLFCIEIKVERDIAARAGNSAPLFDPMLLTAEFEHAIDRVANGDFEPYSENDYCQQTMKTIKGFIN